MRNFTIFFISPVLLFIFPLSITDAVNAAGGVLIFYLVMLASRIYERYKNEKSEKDQNQ
ncbi:MAG TPA: hypothetical protein H9891_11420 [Candidatus Salinicoccus stercoripullorum]|uniref:Uncharacterized protein n=1 Tax=Candidatus Salinicoccus stercoripullorum TaxID=2838756 RepID=A0A9D1QKJ2_9STAP|nr:hypothetical protein [Candidatus Salinicoccus stercoripullorum]